jgi:hypothetical protein
MNAQDQPSTWINFRLNVDIFDKKDCTLVSPLKKHMSCKPLFHVQIFYCQLTPSPTLDDRSRTHYLEATILEVMRHCPHLALTVPHYSSADTKIGKYFIPKDTQVGGRFITIKDTQLGTG